MPPFVGVASRPSTKSKLRASADDCPEPAANLSYALNAQLVISAILLVAALFVILS